MIETMDDKYQDGSDHIVCPTCEFCVDCGDCTCDPTLAMEKVACSMLDNMESLNPVFDKLVTDHFWELG